MSTDPDRKPPAAFTFTLSRVGGGLYAQVSDDAQQAWLVYRYEETGDAVRADDSPILGTFWGAARIAEKHLARDSDGKIVAIDPGVRYMEYRLDAYTDNHLLRRDVLTYLASRQQRPTSAETR